MKRKMFLITILLIASLPLISCGSFFEILNPPVVDIYGFKEYANAQPPFKGATGKVALINNRVARNVTYEEVKDFILSDTTDKEPYGLDSQVCAEFAKKVHDNAEMLGIKCGWVSIIFNGTEIGHACNVFNTIDTGLVFVDCTGSDPARIPGISTENQELPKDFDKIAYISIGSKYSVIPIDVALRTDYPYYGEYALQRENFRQKLSFYNSQVAAFNEENRQFKAAVGGRKTIQNPREYDKLKTWQNSLDAKRDELTKLESELETMRDSLGEFYFEPKGIVKEVGIYW